jgi:hypothetical protein
MSVAKVLFALDQRFRFDRIGRAGLRARGGVVKRYRAE